MEKYSFEKAQDEANEMQKKVESGEVENYEQAQDIVEQENVHDIMSQAELERLEYLDIQRIVLENIENKDFRKKISFGNHDKLTEETFKKTLDQLLLVDINLSKRERMNLFKETLEYYANNDSGIELPIAHSTSSYTLRKALEDGFEGGHGDYSGEHSLLGKEKELDYEAQKSLSIAYLEHPLAELSQQIYAKLNSRESDLMKFMPVDYESMTGNFFWTELIDDLKKFDFEGLKETISSKKEVDIENITDEEVLNFEIPFEELKKRKTDGPNAEKINKEVLSEIKDQKLRSDLIQEARHSFPCFLTFEAVNLKQHLTRFSRGKHEAHLPYEDHYWENLPAKELKEIRVPQTQIKKVQNWLAQKKLTDVNIVPLEIYEVKRLIESNI